MKSKKSSRIECYDRTAVLKNFILSILIVTKSESKVFSKLSWLKKSKTTKMLDDGQKASLSYLQKSYNHIHDILRLYNSSAQIPFTTSETERNYY